MCKNACHDSKIDELGGEQQLDPQVPQQEFRQNHHKREHGLDPKHVQSFNKHAVKGHLEFLKSLIIEKQIPLENIYNEDEKGIQLGGGRKNLPLQYIFSSNNRT